MQAENKKKRSGILVFIIALIGIICALSLFVVIITEFDTANFTEEPDESVNDPKTPTDQPERNTPTETPPPDQPALKPADFIGVCDGHAIENAHEYNRSEDKVHAVFYYPDWDKWEIMYADSSDEDFAYQVELVACGSRVSEEWALSCVYAGGINLIMYDARYKVEIYETQTVRLVDSLSINANFGPTPKCPESVAGPTFLKDRKAYAYPDKDKIIAFIDQYAKP